MKKDWSIDCVYRIGRPAIERQRGEYEVDSRRFVGLRHCSLRTCFETTHPGRRAQSAEFAEQNWFLQQSTLPGPPGPRTVDHFPGGQRAEVNASRDSIPGDTLRK